MKKKSLALKDVVILCYQPGGRPAIGDLHRLSLVQTLSWSFPNVVFDGFNRIFPISRLVVPISRLVQGISYQVLS